MKKIAFISALIFLATANLFANQTKKDYAPAQETPAKGKYALAISFISIGGGIDGVTYGKIDSLIANHPKKPAVATSGRRGREGETTLYLTLSELSKSEKKAFIKNVEALAANKKLVKIEKNVDIKPSK